MKKIISRKEFIKKTGKLTAGALGSGLLISLTSSCGRAQNSDQLKLPFKYVPLNLDEVRIRSYESYHQGGCGFAGFAGIISLLQEKIGGPYKGIPTEMMGYAGGGVRGWGTICGALNGAAAAISIVAESAIASAVTNDLLHWYSTASLPSKVSDDFSNSGQYMNQYVKGPIPKSISGSPLCHMSLTNWCQTTGLDLSSREADERCGRLSADTAVKAVELLNGALEKPSKPVFKGFEANNECMSCHASGKDENNVHGKMSCIQCHGKPHDE